MDPGVALFASVAGILTQSSVQAARTHANHRIGAATRRMLKNLYIDSKLSDARGVCDSTLARQWHERALSLSAAATARGKGESLFHAESLLEALHNQVI